jgi:hypothetical protein
MYSILVKLDCQEKKDHYLCRCPFCGDSQKDKSRGHMEISKVDPIFHCHRCGEGGFIKKIYDFLKVDFDLETESNKKYYFKKDHQSRVITEYDKFRNSSAFRYMENRGYSATFLSLNYDLLNINGFDDSIIEFYCNGKIMSKNIKTENWGVKAGSGFYTITKCINPFYIKEIWYCEGIFDAIKLLYLLKTVDERIIIANLGNKHITSMLNYALSDMYAINASVTFVIDNDEAGLLFINKFKTDKSIKSKLYNTYPFKRYMCLKPNSKDIDSSDFDIVKSEYRLLFSKR